MNGFVQLANQYFLLWVPALFLGIASLVLILRRAWRRWLILWCGVLLTLGATLYALRTPAGTVSYHPSRDSDAPALEESDALSGAVHELFEAKSVEEIEAALVTADGTPTLVEIYTDFGLA